MAFSGSTRIYFSTLDCAMSTASLGSTGIKTHAIKRFGNAPFFLIPMQNVEEFFFPWTLYNRKMKKENISRDFESKKNILLT